MWIFVMIVVLTWALSLGVAATIGYGRGYDAATKTAVEAFEDILKDGEEHG